jgi:hypothetical protein
MTRWFGNLAALVASTLIGLALIEIALRILGFTPAFMIQDRTIGSRWRPGAPYKWTIEGFSQGRMNSAGWRDREYAETKPPGTARILFCGDSFVAALEVALDSTFHKRLERALNTSAPAGRRVEVLAMGRVGEGTTEEYLTYRRWGVRYDPDVVAVDSFVGIGIVNPVDDFSQANPQGRLSKFLVALMRALAGCAV